MRLSLVRALPAFFAVSCLSLPASAPAAESHLKYYNPIREACTRRPLTSAEKAYFAHYSTLRKTLPPTPAGWEAKDLSWTPPDQECVQKKTADYILAVDINYVRPLSGTEHTQLSAVTTAKSPHQPELDQLQARRQALSAKEEVIRKGNGPLADAVQKEFMKTLTLESKITQNIGTSDKGKMTELQAAFDAENAKYQKMKAKLEKANAPLDELKKQSHAIYAQEELLIYQDRVANFSRRYDVRENHSARVFVQLNVTSKNLIRMMNTPLHPESMNNPFVLCINPQKMQVPDALYAWRCSNQDRYNNAANLGERRGAMIVAIFAKLKRDAPALKYANDDYYDRHFKHAEGKNDLLYISGGKIGRAGLLGVQNVLVVVQSDNMATVDKLFSGMDLKPVAQLVH